MDKLSIKEKRALQELKESLASRYNLLEMKLFGSKAIGEGDPESDLDVFILLDHLDWETEKQIYELCFEISLENDVLLSPLLYSQEEIDDPLTRVTPFYQVLEKEGVPL
jgi:predicted nucleotidyltransferase